MKALLSSEDNIEIIDEAADGDELLCSLRKEKPDVLVMDTTLPGKQSMELLDIMKILYPGVKVLMMSVNTDETFIFNTLKHGAKGYITKNISGDVLSDAIRTLYSGQEYFDEQITNKFLSSYVKKAEEAKAQDSGKAELLSPRELIILKLFSEGRTNQEIAEQLKIRLRTVESHKNHIMQKLELKSCVDLIKFAVRNKIIDLD
jgi:two-component system response regulator NreC